MFCRRFIIILSSESFSKETSSITKIRTPSNSCLSMSVTSRSVFLRHVAADVVSPPNATAADPVHAVKKLCFLFTLLRQLCRTQNKNAGQHLLLYFSQPLLCSSVTNMMSCSRPPLVFKILVTAGLPISYKLGPR